MKKMLTYLLLAALCLAGGAQAAPGLPQEGQMLTPVQLASPASVGDLGYLGLPSGQAQFDLGQVKAPYLLVEVFSMYCTSARPMPPGSTSSGSSSSNSIWINR
ncbi:MAG: hypothetical protein V1806_03550 [Pseudomonadota bacterium]